MPIFLTNQRSDLCLTKKCFYLQGLILPRGVITYEMTTALTNYAGSCYVYKNDEKLEVDTTKGSFSYSFGDEIIFVLSFPVTDSTLIPDNIVIAVSGATVELIDGGLIEVFLQEPGYPATTDYKYQLFPNGGDCTVKFSKRKVQYGDAN